MGAKRIKVPVTSLQIESNSLSKQQFHRGRSVAVREAINIGSELTLHLSDVHASGRLEAVVADGEGLVLQQAHELVLLDALLPDPAQRLEPLLERHRRHAPRQSLHGRDRGCGRGSGGGR